MALLFLCVVFIHSLPFHALEELHIAYLTSTVEIISVVFLYAEVGEFRLFAKDDFHLISV